MCYRLLISLAALSVLLRAPIAAQNKPEVPRTPDGHPDLQGIWTNATITPLERPGALAGKATVSDAEARVIETKGAQELAEADGKSEGPLLTATGSAGTGGYNALFIDRGSELARVDGVKRTSLIIDPPDGKVPRLSAEAGRRLAASYVGTSFNSVKDRPLSERCLIGFGSTSGPPMLPVLYNNNYQIVQTPDHVLILVEMVHDARIIRMNGPHAPPSVRQWLGDSVGHWEGTLWWWILRISRTRRGSGDRPRTCTLWNDSRASMRGPSYTGPRLKIRGRLAGRGRLSIHFWRRVVRSTNMPAMKATMR
jgi:hypothetical protein